MINHFALGKLVTYEREEKLSEQLKLIPPPAWCEMRITDWKGSRAATRRPRVIFRDIRIYPVLDAPNAIDHLTGVKLMAAISDLIFGDPLIDALRCRSGGKSLELDQRRADSHFLWPLVQPIEKRCSGLSTASRLANLILRLRVAQLVQYLSTAQVMALGIIDGVLGVMPLAHWREVGVYLDLNSGAIFRLPAGTENANFSAIQPFCTDLLLSRPDQISTIFHVKPILHDDIRPNTSEIRFGPMRKAALTVEMRDKQREECQVWLEGIIGASPNKRTHNRKELLALAQPKWPGLSERTLLDVRTTVARRLGATAWFESGAPRKT